MLEIMYKYAKFQFECGNYAAAAEYLYFYRFLVKKTPHFFYKFHVDFIEKYLKKVPQNNKHFMDSMWGKLSSVILLQKWEEAKEDLGRLRSFIDNNVMEWFFGFFMKSIL